MRMTPSGEADMGGLEDEENILLSAHILMWGSQGCGDKPVLESEK